MNDVQVFNNTEFGDVRALMIEDEPWFVGKDVATALGYSEPHKAIQRHVDSEDGMKRTILTNGGNQNMLIINESGLYSLILSSKLDSAKKFKRWVTSEVLPAIRKTGSYSLVEKESLVKAQLAEPVVFNADSYLRAIAMVATCKTERLRVIIDALRIVGIEIDYDPTTKIHTRSDRDDSGECARMINTAINDYGMTLRGIGNLVGLQATQISRIRSGSSIPTTQRANIICDAIRNAIPDIDNADILD